MASHKGLKASLYMHKQIIQFKKKKKQRHGNNIFVHTCIALIHQNQNYIKYAYKHI